MSLPGIVVPRVPADAAPPAVMVVLHTEPPAVQGVIVLILGTGGGGVVEVVEVAGRHLGCGEADPPHGGPGGRLDETTMAGYYRQDGAH